MKDYLCKQPVHAELISLVADGAYGGEKNISKAMEQQIKLVTTNFTGRKPADIYMEWKQLRHYCADGIKWIESQPMGKNEPDFILGLK